MVKHTKEQRREFLRANIKRGFVLHLDPDYLLLTYGNVTTGNMPKTPVGARYAVCVGVEDGIYFFSMMTTSPKDWTVEVPMEAKEGPWTDNGKISHMNMKVLWVMTLDMVLEAHLAHNQTTILKDTFRYSFLKPHVMPDWPSIPVSYPKLFTPLPLPVATMSAKASEFSHIHVVPDAVPSSPLSGLPPTTILHPTTPEPVAPAMEPPMNAPAPEPQPIGWRTWVKMTREASGLTQKALADKINLPFVNGPNLSAIEAGKDDSARKFTAHELATWAQVLGVAGDPMLRTVPVLTDQQEASRNKYSSHKGPSSNGNTPAPAAALLQPSLEGMDRKAMAARVESILANSRLTDAEALELVTYVERRALSILLGIK